MDNIKDENETFKELTPKELHKALAQVGAYFCSIQMMSFAKGIEIPKNIRETMDDFMIALPQLADLVEMMDQQLDIEKTEDGGKANG